MKALTLTQPWATLMALGEKTIETRSWQTKYRGPILIHAAKGYPRYARAFAATQSCSLVLARRGYGTAGMSKSLPLGAIVARGILANVMPTKHPVIDQTFVEGFVPPYERLFGNYDPHRFAWVFINIEALPEPIPCRGALGLWDCVLPAVQP